MFTATNEQLDKEGVKHKYSNQEIIMYDWLDDIMNVV